MTRGAPLQNHVACMHEMFPLGLCRIGLFSGGYGRAGASGVRLTLNLVVGRRRDSGVFTITRLTHKSLFKKDLLQPPQWLAIASALIHKYCVAIHQSVGAVTSV
jgi:hypothetical protein